MVPGDGPERLALQAAATEKLGRRALFLGSLDEPAPVYAASDVFVLPSLIEGIPLALIEAAQHALPGIASDLPETRGTVSGPLWRTTIEQFAPGLVLMVRAQGIQTLTRRVRYHRATAMLGTRGKLTDDRSVPCSLTESHRR